MEIPDGIHEHVLPKIVKPKYRVMLACNTLTHIHINPYADHMVLAYRLGLEYPDIQFYQFFARRTPIDKFRNWVAKTAIELGCYAIVFIDDDMQLPPYTFQKLFQASINYDIVAAFNYIRGYPFKIMAFKWDLLHNRKRLINLAECDLPDPLQGVVPVDAIGTAVCLIKTSVFRGVPAPWFLTGPHGTEDIYMCLKVKDYNPEIKLGMHTEIITGHMLDPEVISHYTRASHMKYVESFMNAKEIEEARSEDIRLAQIPSIGKRELTYEAIMGLEMIEQLK